jgi:hypothetical protein
VGRYGGEWPEMIFRWLGRWWVVVGVGGFGFREEKDGGGVGGCCTAEGEEWGKRGKNDLKKLFTLA